MLKVLDISEGALSTATSLSNISFSVATPNIWHCSP